MATPTCRAYPLMDDKKLRRKLIQGSLSAPLVLTVSKGAVARTTFSACLANNALRPEPPAAVTAPDEAFRVTREVFEVYRRGVRDNDAKKVEGQYVLGWDNKTLYRIDTGGLVRQYDNAAAFSADGFNVQMRPTGRKLQILAYLDETGNVVGLAPQKNGGTWATKSCCASVIGMQKEASAGWRRLFG